MSDNRKEIRNTSYRVKIDDDSRNVEGYALLFDTPSDGLGIEEVIERSALEGVLENSDILALLNHDMNRGILARWKYKPVTLDLEIDEKGLRYAFEAPKTALGDELIEYLKRGEVSESSFAFTVEKDTWEKKEDGTWKRTINKFEQLFDVSPVYSAAYSSTSVYMRGKEDAEKLLKEQEERLRIEQNRSALSAYYDRLNEEFNF